MTPAALRAWPLPAPDHDADKEARGQVLVIGGARELPGPVILAGIAALRAGAGKLRVATVPSVSVAVGCALPEAMVRGVAEDRGGAFAASARRPLLDLARTAQGVVLGPGLLANRATGALVTALARSMDADRTMVLDALALTAANDAIADRACGLIVTPHAGEMAKVLGRDKRAVVAAPLACAIELARAWRCVVVMKGGTTFVTDGETHWADPRGNVGLATSGSGDVLAGLAGGLAARGADPLRAAVWGVHLHALAGERLARRIGPLGYLARELAGEVPALLAVLR